MRKPKIFAVSQVFKGNPPPTCAVTMNTAAPSDMVRAVSVAAFYLAAAAEAASAAPLSAPPFRPGMDRPRRRRAVAGGEVR